MNTRDRAAALASACQTFPFLGSTTEDDLLAYVAAELGDAEALDTWVPHGRHSARAIAPQTILHILASNTPAAALQTLVRGLLLGANNLAKLPSSRLPEVEEFKAALPAPLAERLIFSHRLADSWLERADAVVVFGDDETIAHFRSQLRPGQIFSAHGHKVSLGFVFDDPGCTSVTAAAEDVAAFDQLGCLSPHAFYVAGEARTYAARLAQALDRMALEEVPMEASIEIRAWREDYGFRAANGEPCLVLASTNTTQWTVVYDETPSFPMTPLYRCIVVKPLPADLPAELRMVANHLSCAGIFPATPENAASLIRRGFSRICPLGQMQKPHWTWHQDGTDPLAELVRWVDFEAGATSPTNV